jgi:hypothetical protein
VALLTNPATITTPSVRVLQAGYPPSVSRAVTQWTLTWSGIAAVGDFESGLMNLTRTAASVDFADPWSMMRSAGGGGAAPAPTTGQVWPRGNAG